MRRYGNKFTRRPDFQEHRENAMRPSKYLGYDHDQLGVYLLEREAFAIAEVEFRRAVWLNPFDTNFKVHLAISLFQQKRDGEAMDLARLIQEAAPERPDIKELIRLIEKRIRVDAGTPPSAPSE